MKINLGSKNVAKVEALKDTIKSYGMFNGAELAAMEVDSGVSAHPTSIEETMRGATNRARNSFRECTYSVGIESGLMTVPFTKTGWMETCACAIYDGKNIYFGLSSAFEYPPQITKMILEGIEASEAFRKADITDHVKLGNTEGGIIGLLTKGNVSRKEYTKQAINNALIQLENPELYK